MSVAGSAAHIPNREKNSHVTGAIIKINTHSNAR